MRTRLSNIFAAILSGLLLAAAFPKWDQTWLLIFALVPLLWALRGQSLKAAFWLGLVSGLAHYVALLYWIVLCHPRLREAAADRRHRHPAAAGRISLSLPGRLGPGGGLGRRPGPQPPLVGARPLGGPGDGADLHHQRLPLGAAGQRPLPAPAAAPAGRHHRGVRPLLPGGPGQRQPLSPVFPAPGQAPCGSRQAAAVMSDPGRLDRLRLLPPGGDGGPRARPAPRSRWRWSRATSSRGRSGRRKWSRPP